MGVSGALRRVVTSVKAAVGLSSPAALSIFGVLPTATGQTVTASSAMRVPAVAAAVGLIAETVGNLPIKLHDRETRLALKDHPAYRLTHEDANPWTSAEALRVQLTTDALLHGDGFAVVLRDGEGTPRELHRIEPGSVSVETLPDGEPQYRVKLDQGEARYSFRDILHVSAFGGVAPVILGREAIGLALAFENHVAKLFANGARPSG